ncbi:MAG: AraC family transcriptional regulator [Acidobacteriota bacterium]
MTDTTLGKAPGPARGLFVPLVAGSNFDHRRWWPAPELRPFVQHFWTVAWKLAPGDRPRPETLPHPAVHLVFEGSEARLAGVTRGCFTRTLEDSGRVVGVKFRPAGFYPFLNAPVWRLTDRTVPASEVFGEAVNELARSIVGLDVELAGPRIEAFLRARLPPVDPVVDALNRAVETLRDDREILQVEDIAERQGLGARQLQRLFRRYVGVHPKWVIQRYRLHEALARLQSDSALDWPDLALELGYADQAHFIRDFKGMVGVSPGAYVKRLRKAASAGS